MFRTVRSADREDDATQRYERACARSTGSQEAAFDIVAKDRNYQTQFANIYFLRLAALKPILRSLASERWSVHATETARVLDVVQGDLTWIVGTVYMEMPLKPQVLQDLVADVNLASAVPSTGWRDPRLDSIQLEDESGRLTIVGHKLNEQVLCTGVVLAVLGTETASGEFDVIDILFPAHVEHTLQQPASDPTGNIDSSLGSKKSLISNGGAASTRETNQFVAILSGLELADNESSSLALDLLSEYLTGELFGSASHDAISRISSLIIVGNSTGTTINTEDDAMTRKLAKNKKYGYDSAAYNPRPVELLDDFLAELCKSIDVVLVPGEQDPTNITLPQKAINRIMLQQSSRYTNSTLKLTSNPAYLEMADRSIFCSAGQTIDDLKHYINDGPLDVDAQSQTLSPDAESTLNLAQETLKWAHFAPTAPDTLWTYPFADRDPFIVDKIPQVYLIGNQDNFGQRLVHVESGSERSECSIISVPKFSNTKQMVLLNLDSLQAQVIRFGAGI